MSADPQPDRLSLVTAEEVLRTIYGDDLAGCNVSLDQIAAVIGGCLQQKAATEADLLGVYEKVVEALHLLSTPPDKNRVSDPNELRALLSERLDAIHALTTKTLQTTALVKAQPKASAGPASHSGTDIGSQSE